MVIRCSCGARGDLGELVEHATSALDNPDDGRAHGWEGEPERIAQARASRGHRDDTRQRIADQLGVSVADLREALR